jgi:hypothetical protein
MANLRDVNIAGTTTLGQAAAQPNQAMRKGEFDTLAAQVGDVAGLVATETEIRVSQGNVFISQISVLSGSVGQNSAAIVTERNIRISEDAALASVLEELSATVAGNTASISSLSQVLSTTSGTLSTRLDVVSANFNGFQATVSSQFTAFANADGALSSRIDQVSVDVAGNTAAITEEATVRAEADGEIHARWGVDIDINGRISGIELLDGTNGQSTFTIRADVFQIVNPDYPDNPFPSKVIASGDAGERFQTQLGGGTPNQFTGGNGTVSRNANVFILGRLDGVGFGTGFSLGRLRYAGVNTIVARFRGQCRNATMWYRVIGQFTDWRPLAALGWLAPTSGSGNFHTIVGDSQHDISVGATEQLEVGFNGLNGNGDGDTDDDTQNDIWAGSMMIEVVNY